MRRLLLASLCALVTGCAATPTTLTVRAVFPDGEPSGAAFLDVAVTGYGDGGSQLIYERPALDAGDRDQTFVVILPSPAVGHRLNVVVQARESDDADGGVDAALDAGPGDPTGRVVATGSGEVLILGDRDNALTIELARL